MRHTRWERMGVALLTLAFGAHAGEPEAEWQKIEARLVPLTSPRQVLTPGVFDRAFQHMLVFKEPPKPPVPGQPKPAAVANPAVKPPPAIPPAPLVVELGLPHAGKDAAGKPRLSPPVRIAKDFVWIDLDGDGKPSALESKRINPDGHTEPFSCDLFYDDGSTGKYSFCLRTIIDDEKYAVIRCCARTFNFNGKTVTLFDDDGNGKYNDVGRDSVLVEGQPVCYLGKYMRIGNGLFELLVQPSGATVEVRTAPKDLSLGEIQPFEKYTAPQHAENLILHTLIVSGPEGAFSFDEAHRTAKVPAGAYNLSFGLFERGHELVYLKNGEKTSFTIISGQVMQPKWGAPVKVHVSMSSDGEEVTLTPPQFFGALTEEYVPDSARLLPCLAHLALVYRDQTHFNIEAFQQFSSKRFETLSELLFKPLVIHRYRNQSEEYEALVEYQSGVIGRIEGKERFSFVWKKPEAKPK